MIERFRSPLFRPFTLAKPAQPEPPELAAQNAAVPENGADADQQDVQRDAVFHADAMQPHDDFPGSI